MNNNSKRNLILNWLEKKPRGEYNIASVCNGMITADEHEKILRPLRNKNYIHYRTAHEEIHKGTLFIEIKQEGIDFILQGGYQTPSYKLGKWLSKNNHQNLKWLIVAILMLLTLLATILSQWHNISETILGHPCSSNS